MTSVSSQSFSRPYLPSTSNHKTVPERSALPSLGQVLNCLAEIHFILWGEPHSSLPKRFEDLSSFQKTKLSKLAKVKLGKPDGKAIFKDFRMLVDAFEHSHSTPPQQGDQTQLNSSQPLDKVNAFLASKAREWNIEVNRLKDSYYDYLMYQDFEDVLNLSDSVSQTSRLTRRAQARDIEVDQYIELFKTYRIEKQKYLSHSIPQKWEHSWGVASQAFENWNMLQFFAKLGSLSILIGLALFLVESPQRKEQAETEKQQERYAAWTLLATTGSRAENSEGERGDTADMLVAAGGMIDALEDLTKECREKYEYETSKFSSHPNLKRLKYESLEYFGKAIPFIDSLHPNFECLDIRRIEIEKAHLPRIKLPGSKLTSVVLNGAGLWKADFRGADLREAQLRGAALNEARFSQADFQGAWLAEADFTGADLTEANLAGANLIGADLSEVKSFTGANFNNALYDANTKLPEGGALDEALAEAVFIGKKAEASEADFRFHQLENHDLRNIDLSKANLKKANLRGADLRGVNLKGANLIDTDLKGANLEEADLTKAIVFGTDLSMVKNFPEHKVKGILYRAISF